MSNWQSHKNVNNKLKLLTAQQIYRAEHLMKYSSQLAKFIKRKKKVPQPGDPIQSTIFVNFYSISEDNHRSMTNKSISCLNKRAELMKKYGTTQSIQQQDQFNKVESNKSKRSTTVAGLSSVRLPSLQTHQHKNRYFQTEPDERVQSSKINIRQNDSPSSKIYSQTSQLPQSLRFNDSPLPQICRLSQNHSRTFTQIMNLRQPQQKKVYSSRLMNRNQTDSQADSIIEAQFAGKSRRNVLTQNSISQKNPLQFKTYYARLNNTHYLEKKSKHQSIKSAKIELPQRELLAEFIKNYKPLHKHLKMDQFIRRPLFKIRFGRERLYFGEQLNEKPNGFGVQIQKNYIYEGKWKSGAKKNGYQLTQQGVYKGEFNNEKRDGRGQFFWSNGQSYSGEWNKGVKQGSGIWKSKQGDSYIGKWINGTVQGFGVHLIASGQRYEGQFTQFLKQGKGKETFPNGDTFEGQFKNGQPNGFGEYKWAQGVIYKGSFINGIRSGEGQLIGSDGFHFKGTFQKQLPNGYGQLKYGNSDSYEGYFQNGKKHGKGALHKVSMDQVLKDTWFQDNFVGGE